jgi:acetyl esterase/lipase
MNILLLAMMLGSVAMGEQVIPNIHYGKSAQQTIDLYLPANRDTATTKLMILIHGGAWANGDKADFTPYIEQLKKQLPDYAFANVNYRLFNNGDNAFPTQENDIKAAIDWLLSRHAEYGYSKEIVLLGASAGAHLALLQGYKHRAPRAIISFFGPTYLVHLYNNPGYPVIPSLLARIAGGTPTQNKANYEAWSPVYFVKPSSPPTLILHGQNDMLVPPVQSKLLVKRLAEAGVKHKFITYPGVGHGWRGATLTDSFTKIVSFLQSNVP